MIAIFRGIFLVLLFSSVTTGCIDFSKSNFGWPKAKGCYERHLEEAVEINQERRRIYRNLADKIGGPYLADQSFQVSTELINAEQLSQIGKYYFDYHGEKFQKMGINIVCNEFVAMEHLKAPVKLEAPLTSFTPLSTKLMRKKLTDTLKTQGFAAILTTSQKYLGQLSAQPAYHCMTRHTLESLRRIAYFAQTYPIGADTHWLSEDLIKGHIYALDFAGKIDRLAQPLQEKGIPIICHDVPHIPMGDHK